MNLFFSSRFLMYILKVATDDIFVLLCGYPLIVPLTANCNAHAFAALYVGDRKEILAMQRAARLLSSQ